MNKVEQPVKHALWVNLMPGERISRNQLYIMMAMLVSWRGTCRRKQVGCVIVSADGRVISTGYNGTLKGALHCTAMGCDLERSCQHSIHAEANAIVYGAKSGISLGGSIMYCTTAPCYTCAQLIVQAGIYEVVYLDEYTDDRGKQLLKDNGITVDKHEQVTYHKE